MSESKPTLRHPLFDPTSTYSRMRRSVRPEYKMRGYFHWQKARAIRLGLLLPEREPEHAGHLASSSSADTVRVWNIGPGSGRSIGEPGQVFRVTDVLAVRPLCLFPGSPLPKAILDGSLVLVREADGMRTVGMFAFGELSGPPQMEHDQPVSCRAFLIEPEVLERLQKVVQKVCGVGPDRALDHAFAAETVSSNMDIARLLSAIPDLDGEVWEGQIRFHRLPIAAEFETFPPRQEPLTVVLVCDASAVIDPAKLPPTGTTPGERC